MALFILCLAAMPAWAEENTSAGLKQELRDIHQQLRIIGQQLQIRLDTIEKRLDRMEGAGKAAAVKAKKPRLSIRRKPAAGQAAALTVCRQGCDYADLNRAIKALKSGGTITMKPGLSGTCGVIDKPLKLVGLKDKNGRRAHLAGGICWGKAPLVVRAANVTITGLEISNAVVRDRNGACIRIDPEAADLLIDDLYCHDSENGILGGPRRGGVTVINSLFERNGRGGRAHGLYINGGDVLTIRNTRILSSKGQGHTLKTGARRTIVEDSVLAALDGKNSRAIDAYAGGELIVRRSVLQQSKNTDNHEFIGVALESRRINPAPHSTTLEENWFIYDDQERCCRWLLFAKLFGPFIIRNNRMVGLTGVHLPSIENQVRARNSFFKDRDEAGLPVYDGTLASLPKPGGFPRK
ncbi:MAG: right-handed parallel beta-helix repeat-containing protein [Alphaproteobacteria bacterium]